MQEKNKSNISIIDRNRRYIEIFNPIQKRSRQASKQCQTQEKINKTEQIERQENLVDLH